jgi:hypothetical protein
MTTYNGHKNWNHWNVSLWINNDEKLYRIAQRYVKSYGRSEGAKAVYEDYFKGNKTPDGAPYSKSAIRAAMVGM